MRRYYITDRRSLIRSYNHSGDPAPNAELAINNDERLQRLLLENIERVAAMGVEYIQLRERDLDSYSLEALAKEAIRRLRCVAPACKLLINSRVDIAIASGAAGVHLRSEDLSPSEARFAFARAGRADALVAVSCHSQADVEAAGAHGADFVVLGPVFVNAHSPSPPMGIGRFRTICKKLPSLPILALGGVTAQNQEECLKAGAAGIAGIRAFQQA